jgi:uncharacterized membrane protein
VRDPTVSDDDLAVQAAKQKLATIEDRPGYIAAIRAEPTSRAARAGTLVGAAAAGGITYACTQYVSAAWLMWILVPIFGVLALALVLVAIGMTTPADKWAAAVVGKQIAGDKRMITFLDAKGARHEIDVAELLYDGLRPGDLGVVRSTGKAPHQHVEAFERL